MNDNSLVWAGQILGKFGYTGLGVTLALNCLGIPIASEVTLPLAGIAIHSGDLDPAVTMVTAIIAQMIGFTAAYVMARRGGIGLIEKYGHYVFINHRQVTTAQRLFRKHGSVLMLIGLCMPGVHGYMGYSAGLARMKPHTFGVIALLGTSMWTLGLIGVGFLFGDHLPQLMAAGRGAGTFAFIGFAIGVAVFWYSRARKRAHPSNRPTTRRSTVRATAKLR